MILGRFYYRQSDTGNLLGEFSHNSIQGIVSESADAVIRDTRAFIGSYSSTWFEDGAHGLTLDIELKRTDDDRILILRWSDGNRNVFFGEGFVANGILIGTYWDIEMNELIPE